MGTIADTLIKVYAHDWDLDSLSWNAHEIGTGANSATVTVDNWPATQPVSGTFWQTTQPVSGTFWQSTQPVSIAAIVTTKETRAATTAVTSVNDSAANQTLLASNANRLGATIHNDSTVALYLKLGATASLTSFTVKMAADSYFEVPYGYTGIIDGIWASDASGAARITELT
jgi:hypothetical protein